MIDALSSCGDIFEQFGGHAMAAGFTIKRDNLKKFREIISSIANETLENIPKGPELIIDAEITPNWLNQETMSFLTSLEPYGNGNPTPIFISKNITIVNSKKVGRTGSHLKLSVSHNGNIYDAIAFRQGNRIKETKNELDIAYTAKINSWNGTKTIQLTIEDFKPSNE
jgi:single-stranded-DNA-specific exonuclease